MNPQYYQSDVPLFPPSRLKVFAPNGDVQEYKGWALFVPHKNNPRRVNISIKLISGESITMNPKVVIVDTQRGTVIYSPREIPPPEIIGNGGTVMTESLARWLKRNLHWPRILELESNPVGEDDNERLTT